MWTVWLGCAAIQAPPSSSAELMQMLAGPEAVRQRGGPDPAPAGTPGSGPLPAYADRLRAALNPLLDPCAAEVDPPRSSALVVASIAANGDLLEAHVERSSGSEGFDQCVVRSFQGADLPAPPAELVVNGRFVSPKIAFR